MRRLSLRTRTLIISTVLAAFISGGTAVATYTIVLDGMRDVASNSALHLAETAKGAMRIAKERALRDAAASGRSGESLAATADEQMFSQLAEEFAEAGVSRLPIAVYDGDLRLKWKASEGAVMPGLAPRRKEVRDSGLSAQSTIDSPGPLAGLFSGPRLGAVVTQVPVTLPGGAAGVLDVVYHPAAEEAVIDQVRAPMIGLVLASMFLMIVLMQASMIWLLGLIADLRHGADSIDAGRLDERLPVKGEDEIAALAISVNGLIERLERRANAQARFVADASHELATPVAGIRGYTSILRAWGAEDSTVRDEAIDAIDRESRRMARLTGDLLNLLHADQGLVLKSNRFDLNALSRQQLATSASRWLEKDIEYVGPDKAPLPMVGDPDRVEDIMSILLDNASKYTPVGGRVSVTTRRRRDTITFEVADTGQGIPAADLLRIFDRFYRSESSRAAGEPGFGLGLAIAQSIVQSMGGEISVSSVVREGTTFTVKLPRGRN